MGNALRLRQRAGRVYDGLACKWGGVCQFYSSVRFGTLLAYPLDETAPVG